MSTSDMAPQEDESEITTALLKLSLGAPASDGTDPTSSSLLCAEDAPDETSLPQQSTRLDACEPLPTPKPAQASFEWRAMPAELRLIVLEEIAQMGEAHPPPEAGSLPTVCAEWRSFFEKRNFRALRVTRPKDVVALDRYVSGRREGLVELVTLFVPLGLYDCWRCDRAENQDEKKANNRRLSSLLLPLLDVLSTWSSPRRDGGVALKVAAASMSDAEHQYGDFADVVGDPEVRRKHHVRYSHFAGFSKGSAKRTVGSLLDFDIDSLQRIVDGCAPFPEARVVTQFCLDSRYYRSLSANGLGILLRCLPNLTVIQYGYRRAIGRGDEQSRDAANLALLQNFPYTAETLTLVEHHDTAMPVYSPKAGSESIAAAAVEASRLLSCFHGYNAFDAVHFFKDFYPDTLGLDPPEPWERLRELSLTSRIAMRYDGDSLLANRLLVAAANAALHMPRLEYMRLWMLWKIYGAFVFCYTVSQDATAIEAGAAWPFDLSEAARDAWGRVAYTNTHHSLSETSLDSAELEEMGGQRFLIDY
ncbi:hypothetical protein LX36DRAFT_714598 [Colletotrichum falcatum]|nr:hypothetical protein LX36DRAFT_714598 [Colletotrichum falcatum]